MRAAIAAGLLGVAIGLAALSAPGLADSINISSGVWAKFQQYKDQLKSGDDEYFAASSTGGFNWDSDKDKALSGCQQYSNGATCIIFAHNDQILVDYHVKQ
jgi:hypothetical protein